MEETVEGEEETVNTGEEEGVFEEETGEWETAELSGSADTGGPIVVAAQKQGWRPDLWSALGGLIVGVLVAVLLFVLFAGGGPGNSAAVKKLTAAYEECGSPKGIELRDDGRTLVFDHKGEEDSSGADLLSILCVFSELDMPSSVSGHVDQTTAMDGRQTEAWDSYEIQWSYHPDRGLDGVLKVMDHR